MVDLKFDFGLTHSTFISTLTQSTSTSKNTPWSILDLQNLLSIVVDNSSFHFGGFFFWLFCHSREDFDSFVLVTCSRSLHMVNFCVHAPPYCVKHCTNDALFIQEWTYDKESHQCFSEPTNAHLSNSCLSNSDGTQKELGIMLLEFGTQTENRYLITSSGVEKGWSSSCFVKREDWGSACYAGHKTKVNL